MRIVSLLPSATEIVYALGRGADLVGRSAECDYPVESARLPVVMRPRTDDRHRSSGEIDARVLGQRTSGESLYVLDVPLLASLAPDVILTQDLCGVCSVTGEEVRAACQAARIDPLIASFAPRSLEGILDSLGSTGRAIGAESAAYDLVEALRARQAAVVAAAPLRPRSVMLLEWLDPPILAGLWAPEMVALAGGLPRLHPSVGEPGLRRTWGELAGTAPEMLVVSPCSFPVDRTSAELARTRAGAGLAAVAAGSVVIADEAYFSRPGPRLWDGMELLSDLVGEQPPRAPMPIARWRAADGALAA